MHASLVACMNLGYAYLNDNTEYYQTIGDNTTLKNLFAQKMMHHTITSCMDNASDEMKNASLNHFKDAHKNPEFDYRSFFNSSYFVDPKELL